ncbi:hypothetical protein HZF02_00835 [Pseudomonas yamanorum]|nr:hypothetical protein HZF02_00835 [Pseudomonas yamanorum]
MFAYIFERSRPAKATIRFVGSSIVVVLTLATGVVVLVGVIWVQPERDFIDAQLEGASCGKYMGDMQQTTLVREDYSRRRAADFGSVGI